MLTLHVLIINVGLVTSNSYLQINFVYYFLLYKIECFIDFSATNKINNLTCVIIHDNLTCVNYHETH